MISNLLYEIRSNLEKKGVNPDNISLKKSSHFQEMYAPMKFRQEIPQYDAFENKHFLETLQRKTRSQQEIDLEKKLKRWRIRWSLAFSITIFGRKKIKIMKI